MATQVDNESAIQAFDADLAELKLRGHWRGVQHHPEPVDHGAAEYWRWDDIYRNLLRAGALVSLDYAGRRTLQLITPGLNSTSPNVQMSVQLVKPGELATAHRHTFAAVRFVVYGSGATTTVDGEAIPVHSGDLVTTPAWGYHDHTNQTDEPVIWLDIHDNPFVSGSLNVKFGERYPEPAQPITQPAGRSRDLMGVVRPKGRTFHPAHLPAAYPWSEVRPALERAANDRGDACDGVILDYVNPVTGGHLLPTFGARIQMLRPGEATQKHRHTSTTIYHVVEGEGVTVVGDHRIEWNKHDCFTVPNWQWHAHIQRGAEPAILFSVHDQPILEAFDLYREERDDD